MINRTFIIILKCALLTAFVALIACNDEPKTAAPDFDSDNKILLFSKTEGYRHASIPDGVKALQKIANENNWLAHHTENASIFTSDSLDAFTAIIFLNTTGNILDEKQQSSFRNYMQQGGGFVGIHSATDTEYEWPWYGTMAGAYFESHPEIQEARLKVIDQNHSATRLLPVEWIRTDEWYNFENINPDINILITIDESSYQGGKNGANHPIAWYHKFDGGRIFYTAGGHTSESYNNEQFLNHLWGGIEYVTQNSSD